MLARNGKLVTKQLFRYLVPSVLMVLAMQFGSLLDGILIGNLLSGEALTASSLVLPVLFLIQLPGFALGVGGSIAVGIRLGERDTDRAKETFSVCMLAGLVLSGVIAALSPLLAAPLASLYAPPELQTLARDYILVYMATDPIVTFSLMIAFFMNADNNPKASTALFIIANAVKIGTEILFLGPLKLGMTGAALSTAAGQVAGLITLIWYVRSDKRMLRVTMKWKTAWKSLWESIRLSAATSMNLLLTAVQVSVANILIANLVTDPGEQLLFGVMANFMFGFDLLAGGIVQLVPTVGSVFYGEEDYYSLRVSTRRLLWLTIGVSVSFAAVLMIDPTLYTRFFGLPDPGANGLMIARIYIPGFIAYEISKFIQSYYPSIDRGGVSVVNVILRDIALALPLTIWLLNAKGLTGYAIAQTITEWGTVLLTAAFVPVYRRLRKLPAKGLLLIPPFEAGDVYDVSIGNDILEVEQFSTELRDYARKHGTSETDAQLIALAGEEIASNIITYGFRKGQPNTIDALLKIVNGHLVLRLRDDGPIFDPTRYKPDRPDTTSGLYLVQHLVTKFSYLRVLNTNNTVMELKINAEEETTWKQPS